MKPSERITALAQYALQEDQKVPGLEFVGLSTGHFITALLRYLDEQAEPRDTYDWCAKHNCAKTLMSHPPQCGKCFAGEPPCPAS